MDPIPPEQPVEHTELSNTDDAYDGDAHDDDAHDDDAPDNDAHSDNTNVHVQAEAFTEKLGTRRVFSRDLLQAVYHFRQVYFGEKFCEDPENPSGPLKIKDVDGKERCVWNPKEGGTYDKERCGELMRFEYFGYPFLSSLDEATLSSYDATDAMDALERLNPDSKDRIRVALMPRHVKERPGFKPQSVISTLSDFDKLWTLMSAIWYDSKPAKELRSLVRRKASQIVPIKKIICFSLGNLCNLTFDVAGYGTLIPYLTAITIAESLGKKNPDRSKVRILAQDDNYNLVDRRAFRKLGIAIVSDPGGYLEIDGSTIVIDKNDWQTQPTLEIIADVTSATCRPAAILTRFDYPTSDRKIWPWQETTPRIAELLELYDKAGFENLIINQGLWNLLGKSWEHWLWLLNMRFYFKKTVPPDSL